mgnify:CR=1 FL=1
MRGTLNLAMADFASADSRGRRAAKATAKLATDVATSVADLLTALGQDPSDPELRHVVADGRRPTKDHRLQRSRSTDSNRKA